MPASPRGMINRRMVSLCWDGGEHTYSAPARPARAITQPRYSGLEEDLERAVLLLLERLVGVRRVLERQPVGGEGVDPERVVVAADQRQQLVHPALDVGLAHAQVDLLVEHLDERRRAGGAAVDARQRHGAAA